MPSTYATRTRGQPTQRRNKSHGWWEAHGRLERLRALAGEGLSAGKIAKALDNSRSAICAKCARLGIRLQGGQSVIVEAKRAAPAKPAALSPKPAALSPKKARAVADAVKIDHPLSFDDKGLPLTARPWEERETHQCAWPYSTPFGVFSCCTPVDQDAGARSRSGFRRPKGWSYCQTHVEEMFRKENESSWKAPQGRVPVNFVQARNATGSSRPGSQATREF